MPNIVICCCSYWSSYYSGLRPTPFWCFFGLPFYDNFSNLRTINQSSAPYPTYLVPTLNVSLEPICQESSWPVTGLWNRGPLKILNGIKLILDNQGNHLDSYNQSGIIQVLQSKPVTGRELFMLFLKTNWL